MKSIIAALLLVATISLGQTTTKYTNYGNGRFISILIGTTNIGTEVLKDADTLVAHRLWMNHFADSTYQHWLKIAQLTDSTKKLKTLSDSLLVLRLTTNALTDSVKNLRLLMPTAITADEILYKLNSLSALIFSRPFTINSATPSTITYLGSAQVSVTGFLDLIDGASFRFHGSNSLVSDYGLLYRPSTSRNVSTIRNSRGDSVSVLMSQGVGDPKFKKIIAGTNVVITSTDSSITISSTGSGGVADTTIIATRYWTAQQLLALGPLATVACDTITIGAAKYIRAYFKGRYFYAPDDPYSIGIGADTAQVVMPWETAPWDSAYAWGNHALAGYAPQEIYGTSYLRSTGDSCTVAVSNIQAGFASWQTTSGHIGSLAIVSRGTYFTIFSNAEEPSDSLKVAYKVIR